MLLDYAPSDPAPSRCACEARDALALAAMLGSPADPADAAAAAAACPSAADARYARAAALDRAGRRLDATRALCFGANATAALLVDVAPWERRRGNVPSAATALRAFALMRTCGVAAIPGFDLGAVAAAVDERWDREGAPAAAAAAAARAGQESEIPNFKASYLGRFPLVLADFWTSDHLLERSRSVDVFFGTRLRGTLTLKRR